MSSFESLQVRKLERKNDGKKIANCINNLFIIIIFVISSNLNMLD